MVSFFSSSTIAFMESIADVRDRNKEMAISFVENSLSITAEEAKENKVIDYIAGSVSELLKIVNGKTIKVADNKEVILNTDNVDIQRYEKNIRQQFLEILSNPNIFACLSIKSLTCTSNA